MSPRTAVRLLGQLLLFLAAAMLAPAAVAVVHGEPTALWAYLGSAVATAVCGALLRLRGAGSLGTIHRRDAFLVVAGGWVLAGIFGALPLLLTGDVPSYTDAFFETVSGFTTTGSTILQNIEATTHAGLFWRSLTHWLGGMGIVVLFVAIFPQLGVGGKLLFQSEVPGPITEGLQPRIKQTSAALWRIYVGLTLCCGALLYLCGMNVFDAVNHAMATMATGGYSTKNASVGHYQSVSIDLVTTLFMLMAGINFSLYYLAVRGKWRRALADRELWTYLGIVGVSIAVITVAIASRHGGLFAGMRYAAFQVVAVVTTTGFGTDNFDTYPPVGRLLLVALMFVGGSAGSTAGGMKVFRVMVVAKVASRELIYAFRPQLVRAVRIGRNVVDEGTVRAIMALFALFMGIFLAASLVLAAMGLDIITSTTATIACLGNIGPGLARVGSIENFAFMPTAAKWLLSFCMILGRLEIVTVAALLVPMFWRR